MAAGRSEPPSRTSFTAPAALAFSQISIAVLVEVGAEIALELDLVEIRFQRVEVHRRLQSPVQQGDRLLVGRRIAEFLAQLRLDFRAQSCG